MEQAPLEYSSLRKALDHATQVALDAGYLLLNYLEDPEQAQYKERADLEAERLIRARLCSAHPNWGFRAEEEPQLNIVFEDERPFWLVDPNDGTSAFLRGERGASVSIALIYQKRPILGVIFAYAAPNAKGDLFTWAEACDPLRRNGQIVSTKWTDKWEKSIHFVSNSADQISEAYQQVLALPGQGQAHYRIAPGIAYRLALCAAGEGETAISLASPRDFDFAAGHALLKGAGGELFDGDGNSIQYSHSHPTRLTCSFGGHSHWAQKLSQFNWNPVFLAKQELEQNKDLPFLRPQDMKLSRLEHQVDQIQGAWWGWHCGYLVQKHQLSNLDEEQLIDLALGNGGDIDLIQEARALINGECDWTQSISLKTFTDLWQSLQHKEKLDSLFQFTDSATGLIWGANLGRQQINHRLVSAFLAHRQGALSHWLLDGDRLAEQLLFLLKDTKKRH